MIVLDTHVWVWWLSDPNKLPARARRTIIEAASDRAVYVSSISTWEIALLVSKGRLRFTMDAQDWIAKSETLPFLHFVPVDNATAIRSVRLSEPFHKDPADRLLAATAQIEGLELWHTDTTLKKLKGFPARYFPNVSEKTIKR